ncbi:MAG: rhodanese-related sulfurtransferase [Hyphomicrobiales bacterium]
MYDIAAFYKFFDQPRYREAQVPLLAALKALNARGTVLLAAEGVNGTIAAPQGQVRAALREIEKASGSGPLEAKFATSATPPFRRMKVRLKKEIVTIGAVKAAPHELVGEYVEPAQWNALISDPDVIVVDTRNDYEYRVGTFRNAVDPGTDSFSEFPGWVRRHLGNMKGKKIATFCTGGIRCEKATSFMRFEGFEHVYHLKGGILRYLEEIPAEQSLWDGACYVFDERVAVEHGLRPSGFTTCRGCLEPVSPEDRQSPLYEEGVSCPRCAASLSEAQRASNRERQRQFELAEKRGLKHLGPF